MKEENPGCLGWLFGLFGNDLSPSFPYRTRADFVSRAELSFFQVLRLVVADEMLVCPKVSLGDIFFVVSQEKRQAYRNKIDRKHVDFLLCDPQTLKPQMGIELDDSSHQRKDRQARDRFVDGVFEAAGLPLLHVPARASYVADEIRSLINQALHPESAGTDSADSTPVTTTAEANPTGAPICPRCGIPMVPRESRKDHSRFYGCANYPRCREVAPWDK